MVWGKGIKVPVAHPYPQRIESTIHKHPVYYILYTEFSMTCHVFLGCEYVGTKLNVEEHGETCKHQNSADPPKCQALHSGVYLYSTVIH